MKKVKLFFTAVAVLAVVGGAVAFKSAKTAPKLFFCNTALKCQLTDRYTDVITPSPVTPPYTVYKSNSIPGAPCGTSTCQTFSGPYYLSF